MKTKKLIRKLREIFDDDLRDRRKRESSIRELLAKLKDKERKLREVLDEEDDPDRKETIRRKIRLIRKQMMKGRDLLENHE